MNDLSKCPWCGSAAAWFDEFRGRSGYARWQCGSYKAGDNPTQVEYCLIEELTAEIDRLNEILKQSETECAKLRADLAIHRSFGSPVYIPLSDRPDPCYPDFDRD